MDLIDVDDLIAEVKKRSHIYDTSLKEYYDVKEKKKLWYQIFQIIYTPAVWDELSTSEKAKYGKNLQKKWATLRRGFRRELALQKSNPSGSAAKKRKRYIYFDALIFLLPFIILEDNEKSLDKEDNETTLERGNNHSANQNLEDNVEYSVPTSKTKFHSTNSNNNYDEEILKALKEENQLIFTNTHKVTDPVTNKTDDDDEAFLKSLLPSIKAFTSDEKLLLRIEIMKTIFNFKKSINYIMPIYNSNNFVNNRRYEGNYHSFDSDPLSEEYIPRPIVTKSVPTTSTYTPSSLRQQKNPSTCMPSPIPDSLNPTSIPSLVHN